MQSVQHIKSHLFIKELSIDLHLGVTKLERSSPQTVLCSIELNFKHPPAACQTDDINDTICYDTLTQNILIHCQKKHYKLIEHLALDITEFIAISISGNLLKSINVEITKNPTMHTSTKCVKFALRKLLRP